MNTTKPRNKRSVPIRFNEDESQKYKQSSKKGNKVEFIRKNNQSQEVKHDSQQGNDHNRVNENNESSHEYIQSSYMRTEQKDEEEVNQVPYGEEYEQEEFEEIYQQSGRHNKLKNVMKGTSNPYELTFKKQMMGQNENENSFAYRNNDSQDYSIPKNTQQREFQQQRDFQDSSQSFQEVPFAQQQPSIDQPNNPQSLSETRQKLFRKYHSYLINYHYFHSKTAKDIQEKHKENLFSLLVAQLQKNIFVNGLKLNFLVGKRNKQLARGNRHEGQIYTEQKHIFNNNSQARSLSKQIMNESLLDELEPKVVIFEQITYGIIKRRIFHCFNLLVSRSKIIVRTKKNQDKDQQGEDQLDLSHNNHKYQQNSNLNNSQEESQYSQPITKKQVASQSLQRQPNRIKKKQSPYNKYQVSQSRQSQPFRNSSSQSHSKSKQQSSPSHQQHQHSKNTTSNQQISQFEDEYQNQEDISENQHDKNQEESEELQRMKELIEYIESLKKEGRETDSQLRRYFIKWKIYMLDSILEDYQRQQQEENQQQKEGQSYQEEQDISQNEYDMHTQRQNQEYHQQPVTIYHNHKKHVQTPVQSLTQRQHSSHKSTNKHKQTLRNLQFQHKTPYGHQDLAQQDNAQQDLSQQNPIQQKKFILKSFLHQNYLNAFWTSFSDNFTNKKLLIVIQKVRQQKLKKKVLQGFRLNIQSKQHQRAMDYYYQEIAQEQDQSQYRTAELNYRTNLKAKYFFELVKTCRNLKWIRKIDKLTLKFAFWKIRAINETKKRKEQHIQRHFLTQRIKALFKSFQSWKDSTILSPNYQKLKLFNQDKDKQILEQYFSVFQILHKQALIKQKKASNYYKSRQLSKVFDYLKFLSRESQQIEHKQRQLREYLTFSRGKGFYQNFYQFYGEKILEHRLNIKAQKLWYNRQKFQVYEKLQEWRNEVIKKQSYRAIEYRLVKLRQKQTKGRIMQIWLNELDKRMNKKDELEQSAQHKDWLVKYYGSLCEIATSGKQLGSK